ncbi:MAG TPA: MarR family transcriptional regulator [Phototrophicaceae bacterium]|jgi:DNA-binding MarR family transcriptional regulator|nr:MarR family transcriptional regulator [Phototrophicaceae bacterium]
MVKQTGKPSDPWSNFALSIFRLNGLIIQAGEGITQPIGQSSARWQVLGRLMEPQTVADMARDIGYARQSVQRVADVLVKEGLIVYKDHPTDRRTKLLELTPQGFEVLTTIYARQVEWFQRIMDKLDANQLAEITNALENIGQILETEIAVDADAESNGANNSLDSEP